MNSADSDARRKAIRSLMWLVFFAIGMGFVEAAVVVYLRRIFCPDGFDFPLRPLAEMGSGVSSLMLTELFREVATLVMLTAVAVLTGRSRPQRWACFMIAFGIWDIFYYVFLKLTINWPGSIFDWDILFLIPWPWVGPVLAPVIISLIMIFSAILVYIRELRGYSFKVNGLDVSLVLVGIAIMLCSFLWDTPAAFGREHPRAYLYPLLAVGVVLWLIGFWRAFRRPAVEPSQ